MSIPRDGYDPFRVPEMVAAWNREDPPMVALAAACEGLAGIAPAQFRGLLSAEDVADIEGRALFRRDPARLRPVVRRGQETGDMKDTTATTRRAAVLRKLRKLMAMARDGRGSEHEEATALRMANALMAEQGIDD